MKRIIIISHAIVGIGLSFSAMAFDHLSYISSLSIPKTPTQESVRALTILEACGGTSQMDIECATRDLSVAAQNDKNAVAQNILSQYNQTQTEGRFNQLAECRTQSHQDTNFVLGHCVLLLNYFALRDYNKDSAVQKYETCLQGGLIGLAYEGNMSAQYLLSQLMERRNISESAEVWRKSLEFKKGTEEDILLRKCYF